MVSFNIQKCQSCEGDLVTDNTTKEVFCKKCGLMIKQTDISLEPEHYSIQGQPSKSRTGGKISNKYHDNGLSTTISNVKRDAMGNPVSKDVQQQMNKLRKMDNRYKITSSKDRCLRNALFLLNELEERLSLPVHIVEEASSLYRRVIDSKLVGGRTIMGMMCACVYASCRINSMPISIREIAKSGFIRHRDVAMCYRIICKELDIQSDVIDPAKNIPKIANKLGLDQSTISVASNIIKLAQKAGIVAGKNPMAIAAAAIYLSSILNNKPVTQEKITMASDITEATIRARCKGLKKITDKYKKSK
jgi:transcription initiation factor TFIIB